jgi:diguanylate cyclase (GGDEF)-like protein/PAS domain S-box-containing protein
MTSYDSSVSVMLDAAPVCGSVWNHEGRSVDCNAAALHFFGLAGKQSYLDHYAELSPQCQPGGRASGPLWLAHLHKGFLEGVTEFTWQFCRLDGRIIPARITMTRVRHGGDELVVAYALDQSSSPPAEALDHSSDTRARLMLDNAPLACTIWNTRGEFIDCNLETLRMFGLSSKQEYMARNAEFLPEYQPDGGRSEDLQKQYVNQALQVGRVTIPWMRQTAAGDPIPCEVTLLRGMQDEEPFVLAFLRDLREERRLQAEASAAEERSQIMFDATPLGCTFWDEESRLVDCNLEAIKLFGLTSKQEFLDRFFELSPERQPDGQLSAEAVPIYIQQAHHEGNVRLEWMHRMPDGEPLPVEVTLVRVQRGQGHVIAAYLRDLREERKLQAEKRAADERTQIMLDATPLACSFWDEESRLVDCNQESVRLFGLTSKQEFLDRFFELSPERQPDGQLSAEMVPRYIQQAHHEGHVRLEWMHRMPGGEPLPVEVILVRVQRGQGHVIAAYTRDLRELKKNIASLKRLEMLANTDKLTNVANRRYLMEHGPDELGQLSPGGSASLLFFDIDHFKLVNDTYGHTAGDVILQGVADRIRKSLRPDDLLARYGGEEFVILLMRSRLDTALSLAERLRETIARAPFEWHGQTIQVTISIGVACCGYPVLPLQDFIDQADAACYQAKHRGRNRVEHLQPAE